MGKYISNLFHYNLFKYHPYLVVGSIILGYISAVIANGTDSVQFFNWSIILNSIPSMIIFFILTWLIMAHWDRDLIAEDQKKQN